MYTHLHTNRARYIPARTSAFLARVLGVALVAATDRIQFNLWHWLWVRVGASAHGSAGHTDVNVAFRAAALAH